MKKSNPCYLLGIDIGTSGVKAVLFDEDGRSISTNHQEYHFINPKPGLSEIDPEEVWKKTVSVVKECVVESGRSKEQIVAMGLSVLGETTMPLDEKGNPLYPAIDSQDKRDNGYQTYLAWFKEQFGAEEIFQNAKHPYARALISSIPIADPEMKRERLTLKGEVPSLIDLPPGCRFCPRCPLSEAKCRDKDPALTELREKHFVACHYAE